jgi:hypothetical protein
MKKARSGIMEKDKKEQPQKHATRVAIIGLVGTLLTVCGGLAGVLIGGATTIYKVEQENQLLSIAAPQSDQPLAVDTRQIAIDAAKVTKLDPAKNRVDENLGFVMSQPMPGWDSARAMVYSDIFLEEDSDLSPLVLFSTWVKNAWDDQPLTQMRYGEPVTIQFVEGSTENGAAVDPAQLRDPSINFYSRFIVLALDKSVVGKDFTLYDLSLDWGIMHRGAVNDLVSNPDSRYVFEQVSWKLENVMVAGRKVDLTLQRWALFAEGPQYYYIVELQYVPAPSQSMQVMDDLQAYLDGFRVIH